MDDIGHTALPPLAAAIETLLLQGAQRETVEEHLAKHENKFGKPTAEEINAAYPLVMDRWITQAEADEENIYAWHLAARRFVYLRSCGMADYKTALRALQDIGKLQQQYNHAKKQKEVAPTRSGKIARIKQLAQQGEHIKPA